MVGMVFQVRTVVRDVGGSQAADEGEGFAVCAAFCEDGEPLLCGERGGGLHYGGYGDEGETRIGACGVLVYVLYVRGAIRELI